MSKRVEVAPPDLQKRRRNSPWTATVDPTFKDRARLRSARSRVVISSELLLPPSGLTDMRNSTISSPEGKVTSTGNSITSPTSSTKLRCSLCMYYYLSWMIRVACPQGRVPPRTSAGRWKSREDVHWNRESPTSGTVSSRSTQNNRVIKGLPLATWFAGADPLLSRPEPPRVLPSLSQHFLTSEFHAPISQPSW